MAPNTTSSGPTDGALPGNVKAVDSVPVTAIAMKLLDIRLKPSGAILQSFIGEFTATGQQEIVLLKAGGTLELHRIVAATDDGTNDKTHMKLVSRMETHSVLRSCAVIRLSGGKRDILAVGADGGAVSIIDFEGPSGKGQVLHCMIFGKTGTYTHMQCCCYQNKDSFPPKAAKG